MGATAVLVTDAAEPVGAHPPGPTEVTQAVQPGVAQPVRAAWVLQAEAVKAVKAEPAMPLARAVTVSVRDIDMLVSCLVLGG